LLVYGSSYCIRKEKKMTAGEFLNFYLAMMVVLFLAIAFACVVGELLYRILFRNR